MKYIILPFLFTMTLVAGDFTKTEKNWRKDRETRLKAESGWLNLAGLFWLEDGVYRFGTSPDMDIVFPEHSSIGHAGTLEVKGNEVVFKMKRAQAAYLNGTLQREGVLKLESAGAKVAGPDILAHNNLRMFLILRGGQLAMRLRDLRAEALRAFKPIPCFPPRAKYVVQAKLQTFDLPKKVFLATEIETETIIESPGLLRFELKGKQLQLLSLKSGDDDSKLFVMFTDKTTGIDTYSTGRYLLAKKTGELTYELNFNRAYNPPCAFTPFATCPFPPEENSLDIAIKAGEKIYETDKKEGAEAS